MRRIFLLLVAVLFSLPLFSADIAANKNLSGVFSVSDNKKISFAPGNVQYQPSTKSWRFAENQWTVIGEPNKNIIEGSYKGWIDLFSWSSSGSKFGTNASIVDSDYKGEFKDWGGNFGKGWYTLSIDEWDYLLNKRIKFSKNKTALHSVATVNGVKGLVLLPDFFVNPGVDFIPDAKDCSSNVFDADSWAKLESAGAVFLPATGSRYVVGNEKYATRYDNDEICSYWSSTKAEDVSQNQSFIFSCLVASGLTKFYENYCWGGISVRLVREADSNKKSSRSGLVDGQKISGNADMGLPGIFSVGENKKINFASGNTQYNASKKSWRFAENQWDVIGADNENVSRATYEGWLDLFGWSSVASNFGVSNSKEKSDYSGQFVDWGEKFGKGWRTLSYDEWKWLLNKRPNAKALFSQATVNGIKGVVLLPDGFVQGNIPFVPNAINWTTNQYDLESWKKFEKAGAVFLPIAGVRDGDSILYAGEIGCYRSSDVSSASNGTSSGILIQEKKVAVSVDLFLHWGLSVRLVRNVK